MFLSNYFGKLCFSKLNFLEERKRSSLSVSKCDWHLMGRRNGASSLKRFSYFWLWKVCDKLWENIQKANLKIGLEHAAFSIRFLWLWWSLLIALWGQWYFLLKQFLKHLSRSWNHYGATSINLYKCLLPVWILEINKSSLIVDKCTVLVELKD